MNKGIKIVMVIAVIFLGVGLVLCGVTLPGLIRGGTNVLDMSFGNEGADFLWLPGEDLEGIESIKVVADAVELFVYETPDTQLRADVYHSQKEAYEYFLDRQEKSLVITIKQKNGFWAKKAARVNLAIPTAYQKNMEIDVNVIDLQMSNVRLEELRLSIDAGNADLEHVKCNQLMAQVDAGKLEIQQGEAKQLHAQVNTGRLAYQGKADKVDFKVDVGEISTELSNAPQTISAQSNLGSIDILLPSNLPGFVVNSNVNMGDFTCDFPGMVDKGGSRRYGDGSGQYDIKVNAGRVRLGSK